ncbi:MAG: hypothetical protein LBR79_01265 [Oscillospiraceae bacterium]|nr:hypothetical protein [Oscillospiraceae bacterium]
MIKTFITKTIQKHNIIYISFPRDNAEKGRSCLKIKLEPLLSSLCSSGGENIRPVRKFYRLQSKSTTAYKNTSREILMQSHFLSDAFFR